MVIKKLLRGIVPDKAMALFEDYKIKNFANLKKREILRFLHEHPDFQDREIIKSFIEKNGVHVFPYPFVLDYPYQDVEVLFDESNGLQYVMLDEKRLYYKAGFSNRQIQRRFAMSLIEQDKRAAHCYSDKSFAVAKGDVLADVGVAEGNFSLINIERASHVYLFEPDKSWMDALEATFAPWKDKVTIVNKFVSNTNDATNVSLDQFFEKKELDFLKVDVDGGERDLLKGSTQTMESAPLKIALCTYHSQNDAHDFEEIMQSKGFGTHFSKGHMLFYFDPEFKEPFFRKGVIRCQK